MLIKSHPGQTRGVAELSKNEDCAVLVHLDNCLFDILMNWRLDRAHPASAHVDPVHVSTDHPLANTILPLRSKDKCRSQSLAVAETTGCDEWDL
jgi:hypothetical protein